MLITFSRPHGHVDVFLGKDPIPMHGWQRVLRWSGGGRTRSLTVLGWCAGWTRVPRKR